MEPEPAELQPWARLRGLAIDLGPLRRHPAFRRLFVGQTISTFGSEIAAVAAPYQLYQLTHSTLQVGLLSLCELVPLLTLTLAGGAIADAFDRRTIALRTEIALTVVAALFALNATLAHPRVWAIYALVTVAMGLFSLGVASMRTVVPRLVAEDELVAANAIEAVSVSPIASMTEIPKRASNARCCSSGSGAEADRPKRSARHAPACAGVSTGPLRR